MKIDVEKFLIGLVIWVAFVFMVGAGLAWSAQDHLGAILDREIPFYDLWMLCSFALALFGRIGGPGTQQD